MNRPYQKWFNGKMEEKDDWINNVWFCDEAHFHFDVISGELNHRKMVCSDSCKAQGPRLGVQQNLKPWLELIGLRMARENRYNQSRELSQSLW